MSQRDMNRYDTCGVQPLVLATTGYSTEDKLVAVGKTWLNDVPAKAVAPHTLRVTLAAGEGLKGPLTLCPRAEWTPTVEVG